PWGRRAYGAARREFAEEGALARLAAGSEPLPGIGCGLSERVVEIPWVLRHLAGSRSDRVLDVGTAFSPMVYKWLLVRQPHTIEAADLAAVDIPGISGHIADVRRLPLASDSFDVAICLSTLEHIGMNNAQY